MNLNIEISLEKYCHMYWLNSRDSYILSGSRGFSAVIEEKKCQEGHQQCIQIETIHVPYVLTTHKQKHTKTTQKTSEVQLIVIPECHLFQHL